MRAGRLRHKILVQERSGAKDLLGGASDSWSTIATLWASVEPMNVKDYLSSDAQIADLHGKIVIRYNPLIKPDQRILFNGRVLEIQGQPINLGERNREMHIMYIERGLA